VQIIEVNGQSLAEHLFLLFRTAEPQRENNGRECWASKAKVSQGQEQISKAKSTEQQIDKAHISAFLTEVMDLGAEFSEAQLREGKPRLERTRQV